MAAEFEGRLTIAKLNVNEIRATASKYRVRGLPTLLLFNRGEAAVARTGGREPGSAWRSTSRAGPRHQGDFTVCPSATRPTLTARRHGERSRLPEGMCRRP
ncbi:MULTISPECIES: thioredoxin domain-containing protein [Streptomyces]|uniref:Thioredoxin domain-containing protein n=2 Tax=Streptomyces TaxID=1883 RepID=A0ABV9ITS0_9ACTN